MSLLSVYIDIYVCVVQILIDPGNLSHTSVPWRIRSIGKNAVSCTTTAATRAISKSQRPRASRRQTPGSINWSMPSTTSSAAALSLRAPRLAIAIVTDRPQVRAAADVYVESGLTPHDLRIFPSIGEARGWLSRVHRP